MLKAIFFIALTLISFSLSQSDRGTTIRTTTISSPMTSTITSDQQSNEIDIEEVMNLCNESFRIEMSYLASLNESGSFPDETDRTPKCYIRCVLEKAGVVSEDGVFDTELAAKLFAGKRGQMTMDDLPEMAAACAIRQEPCKCEKSYNFIKCLMSMEIERYEQLQ